MTYVGRNFSSFGPRSPSVRPHYVNSNTGPAIGSRQFAGRTISRGNNVARFSNTNRAITSSRTTRVGPAQVRNGNTALRPDWRKHVFAQHPANWQRNWDRRSDHWWHGHRCHFFNGAWFIFDAGFDPWWPYWYDDYYADGYPYPSDYESDYYVSDSDEYYSQNGYDSSGQYADATVAAAQQRLSQQGYYRGEIDGVFGPEMRAAIADYQSDHGLRVTGALTPETVRNLGLTRVASY